MRKLVALNEELKTLAEGGMLRSSSSSRELSRRQRSRSSDHSLQGTTAGNQDLLVLFRFFLVHDRPSRPTAEHTSPQIESCERMLLTSASERTVNCESRLEAIGLLAVPRRLTVSRRGAAGACRAAQFLLRNAAGPSTFQAAGRQRLALAIGSLP